MSATRYRTPRDTLYTGARADPFSEGLYVPEIVDLTRALEDTTSFYMRAFVAYVHS